MGNVERVAVLVFPVIRAVAAITTLIVKTNAIYSKVMKKTPWFIKYFSSSGQSILKSVNNTGILLVTSIVLPHLTRDKQVAQCKNYNLFAPALFYCFK